MVVETRESEEIMRKYNTITFGMPNANKEMAGKLDFTCDQSHSHPSQFLTHFHLETRVKRDLIHHMTAKIASYLNPKP